MSTFLRLTIVALGVLSPALALGYAIGSSNVESDAFDIDSDIGVFSVA